MVKVLFGFVYLDVLIVVDYGRIFGIGLNVIKLEVKVVYCKFVLYCYFDVFKFGESCEVKFIEVYRVYELFIVVVFLGN